MNKPKKLTPRVQALVLDAIRQGCTPKDIAETFDVSRSYIYHIINVSQGGVRPETPWRKYYDKDRHRENVKKWRQSIKEQRLRLEELKKTPMRESELAEFISRGEGF